MSDEPTIFVICEVCGCVVADTVRHAAFHEQLPSTSSTPARPADQE